MVQGWWCRGSVVVMWKDVRCVICRGEECRCVPVGGVVVVHVLVCADIVCFARSAAVARLCSLLRTMGDNVCGLYLADCWPETVEKRDRVDRLRCTWVTLQSKTGTMRS